MTRLVSKEQEMPCGIVEEERGELSLTLDQRAQAAANPESAIQFYRE